MEQTEPVRDRPKSRIQIMGRSGHNEVKWDKSDPTEVRIARRTFEKYRSLGYLAYRKNEGAEDEMITEFDPDAETIVFSPPMRGG